MSYLRKIRYRFKKLYGLTVTLAVRGAGSVLQLIFNMIIGQLYGANLVGEYHLFTNYIQFFSAVWSKGLPTLSLKIFSNSRYVELRTTSHKKESYLKKATREVITFGIFGVVLICVLLVFSNQYLTTVSYRLVIFSAVAAIIFSVFRIYLESMKGCRRINTAFFLEFSLMPISLIVVTLIYVLLDKTPSITVFFFIIIFCMLFSIFVSAYMVGIRMVEWNDKSVIHSEKKHMWFLGIVNAGYSAIPYFFLPFVTDIKGIAFFGVAHRLVVITNTLVSSIASIYGPKFASSITGQDNCKLRKLFRQSQSVTIVTTLPILAVYILFGEDVLLLFGEEFVGAVDVLIVLSIGRVFSVVYGQTETFLNMLGKSNIEWKNAWVSLLVCMVLAIPLSIYWGIVGVAISYSLVFFVRAILSYTFIQKNIFIKECVDK